MVSEVRAYYPTWYIDGDEGGDQGEHEEREPAHQEGDQHYGKTYKNIFKKCCLVDDFNLKSPPDLPLLVPVNGQLFHVHIFFFYISML